MTISGDVLCEYVHKVKSDIGIQMKELEQLLFIMKSLRDPEQGCPWDKVQTIESIKGYTLEEAYEVIDAIVRNNMDDLCDELGDLLFHIIFYSEMADEKGDFNFQDVIQGVCEKLERRHPHVFADTELKNIEQVKHNWEEIKQAERSQQKALQGDDKSYLLDDISKNLPALQRAVKLQKRAASVGFDWDKSIDIINKIEEELDELKQAVTLGEQPAKVAEELGDLLFCCTNLARHYRVDPELVLRATNDKFVKRFNYIEQQLHNKKKSLSESDLQEMDALWNEAKTMLT